MCLFCSLSWLATSLKKTKKDKESEANEKAKRNRNKKQIPSNPIHTKPIDNLPNTKMRKGWQDSITDTNHLQIMADEGVSEYGLKSHWENRWALIPRFSRNNWGVPTVPEEAFRCIEV